jgi:hypothetical protein
VAQRTRSAYPRPKTATPFTILVPKRNSSGASNPAFGTAPLSILAGRQIKTGSDRAHLSQKGYPLCYISPNAIGDDLAGGRIQDAHKRSGAVTGPCLALRTLNPVVEAYLVARLVAY